MAKSNLSWSRSSTAWFHLPQTNGGWGGEGGNFPMEIPLPQAKLPSLTPKCPHIRHQCNTCTDVIQTAPILSNQFSVYMYTPHLTSCLAELSCGSHMETPDSPAQRWSQTALLPHSGTHPLQVKRDEFVSKSIPLKFAAFLERALCGLALSPGPLPLCFSLGLLDFWLSSSEVVYWTFPMSNWKYTVKEAEGKKAERGLRFRLHTKAP